MEIAIELKKLSYAYPNSKKGLQAISLKIPKGKKTVVLGLNGAGKSTFFLTLCGVLKPQSGQYFLAEEVFSFTKKERARVGRKLGYIFQDPEVQLFAPTVWDDVAFGLQNMKFSEEEIAERVIKYLDFLNISHLKDSTPHELSYGQKKLVAIAGVLVMQPNILILDEPFAWLDNIQEQNMKVVLERLHRQGMTIILSTHNLDFAFSWADYGVVLHEGCCNFQDDINELKKHKSNLWNNSKTK